VDPKVERPILVTGAAGRVGAVGRTIVELLRQRGVPAAHWSARRMSAPKRCARPAPKWSLATLRMPLISSALSLIADASISV